MINELEFLVAAAAIGKSVLDGEGVGADFCGNFRPEFELRSVEHSFVHSSANFDPIRRLCFEDYLDFRGGNVPNFAVQSEVHCGFVSRVVHEAVFARMPGGFQTATRQPFVEAFEPAKPAAALEVDVSWVNEFFDGRVPSEPDVAHNDFVDAHAARGNDGKAQAPVVHFDEVYPFLLASAENGFSDGPFCLHGQLQIAVVSVPMFHSDVVLSADQSFLNGGGGHNGDWKRNKRGDKRKLFHRRPKRAFTVALPFSIFAKGAGYSSRRRQCNLFSPIFPDASRIML